MYQLRQAFLQYQRIRYKKLQPKNNKINVFSSLLLFFLILTRELHNILLCSIYYEKTIKTRMTTKTNPAKS